MLNNVLYADLTGVFLVVGCTLFISLVNCLSEIPTIHLCHNIKFSIGWYLCCNSGIRFVLGAVYPRITRVQDNGKVKSNVVV